MPQDFSLFWDLTVAETLIFYSKIYRMKSHLVAERIEFLLKLLDLEQKGNRLINQLSGGQKRRVSLAVALVHSPPLVILGDYYLINLN
jgi:ABC-2 type transport system ATP-binding protein